MKLQKLSFCVLSLLVHLYGVESLNHTGAVQDAKIVLEAITSTSHLNEIARHEGLAPPTIEATLHAMRSTARPCSPRGEERYRRIDGLCNNLRNPFWGSTLFPQRRLFANTYLDGRGFPRTKGVNSSDLPSARDVSLNCFVREEDGDGPGVTTLTQLVWLFGHLITHDVVRTDPLPELGRCCEDHVPGLDHPDLERNGPCFPIETPPINPFNQTCMPFTRSFAVDILGVREPVNRVTSFLDASFVYGESHATESRLRLGSQGLLRTRGDGDLLPIFSGNVSCLNRERLMGCPAGGDVRVNFNQGIGAIQTLFHTEHNRIARKLSESNKNWTDEILYQDARRILIATFQKITYEDYLPLLLGDQVMNRFGMKDPYRYDESVDPTMLLEFSTATFRAGHSQINTFIEEFRRHELDLLPIEDADRIASLLVYFAMNTPLFTDNRFTDEVRELLFHNITIPDFAPEGVGFDLPARDIQRGRDHGIATYTTVRDYCQRVLQGLPHALQNVSTCRTEGVYRDESDVDLYVGGLSETPLTGSLLGPTFACITAMQFQNLRSGDRFFYESTGHEGFTTAQLDFIRRSTLASLICELIPDDSLQRDVFRSVSESNPLVPCQTILRERDKDVGLYSFLSNDFRWG